MYCIICRIRQNIVCITPRFDAAMLSEKSGRGFSRFYFRGIKASAEKKELGPNLCGFFCNLPKSWRYVPA